jgi:hypothetical protein
MSFEIGTNVFELPPDEATRLRFDSALATLRVYSDTQSIETKFVCTFPLDNGISLVVEMCQNVESEDGQMVAWDEPIRFALASQDNVIPDVATTDEDARHRYFGQWVEHAGQVLPPEHASWLSRAWSVETIGDEEDVEGIAELVGALPQTVVAEESVKTTLVLEKEFEDGYGIDATWVDESTNTEVTSTCDVSVVTPDGTFHYINDGLVKDAKIGDDFTPPPRRVLQGELTVGEAERLGRVFEQISGRVAQ